MAQTADIFGGTYSPAGASTSAHADGSVTTTVAPAGSLRFELVDKTGLSLSDYIDVRIADARQGDDTYLGGLG